MAPAALPEIAVPPRPPKPRPAERKPAPRRLEQRLESPVSAALEAPSPAAVAAPPTASAGAPPSADAMANFQRLLLARLDRAKRYPPAAMRRRAQGVAYLRFAIDRSGKVLAARIDRSSGHGDLDEEVLALIKRADPLPPFPSEITQEQLELVIPVQFSLR